MKCAAWAGKSCNIGFCDACVTCIHNPDRDRMLPHLQDILAKRIVKKYGEYAVELAYAQTERKTVILMYFHTFSLYHRIALALRPLIPSRFRKCDI